LFSVSLVDGVGLLMFALLLSIGQLLFKQVGSSIRGQALADAASVLFVSSHFYFALALYGGAKLLWIWLLSRVPLTQAYPWSALAVALVPLMAILILGETVRPLFWIGITLIIAGIVLTQYGIGS
jgi:drug/metabolite transporter (DMT)-like permease